VLRRHDQEIRERLLHAADRNLMLVLVGGSATGKTRTAYAALPALPHLRSWPVLRPTGPRQLLATLDAGVPAERVLWLDDTRGTGLAECLCDALGGPGPLPVVADMWTEHWAAVEWHVRMRVLTRRSDVAIIRIADSFAEADSDEQAELDRLACEDPRLALAVRTAGPGRKVIQVLSGGPQLLAVGGGRRAGRPGVSRGRGTPTAGVGPDRTRWPPACWSAWSNGWATATRPSHGCGSSPNKRE
jgi:hypothetical protein